MRRAFALTIAGAAVTTVALVGTACGNASPTGTPAQHAAAPVVTTAPASPAPVDSNGVAIPDPNDYVNPRPTEGLSSDQIAVVRWGGA